jgi:dihydrolipoamide dehydrogenase
MERYDLIILGGGPAGYMGAERAAHAGLKTLLLEKSLLGGVCLNEGCIPTKAMLYSAKIMDNARDGLKYGVKAEGLSMDHTAVLARKDKVVKTLVSGVQASVKGAGATIIFAEGKIEERTSDGFIVSANGEKYLAARLLIATGASPVILPVPGMKEALESSFAMTNREILSLDTVPERLVVIGGGVVGLEMASYYQSAGSKVTVIEMLDKIAGATDREISNILMRNYTKKGTTFELGAKVTEIGNGYAAYEKDGQVKRAEADKVLLSVGRRPNTAGIGLENIGVQVEKGAVVCGEDGKTNVQNVYCAGDVNGRSMLAHTAYREAEACVNNMLGIKDRVRYESIAGVIYTNPEVATVGETEESAKAKGIDAAVSSVSMRFSGRYVAENEGGDGICKVVADKATGRILGVHMIANQASEIILSAASFIENQMRIQDVKKLVFPHPTAGEAIREAIFKF